MPKYASLPFSLRPLALIAYLVLPVVIAHGVLSYPNQRGALRKTKFIPVAVDKDAPLDWAMHFPAGDKHVHPGMAHASQKEEGKSRGWKPFEPLNPKFFWRAGVCGDLKKKNAHLRGGKFYYGGKIVAELKQGGILDAKVSIVSHHNGFIEFHVCDVAKCGGEISERCFRKGHCTQLQRAPNRRCSKKNSMECGPIDRNYPGRWYLPCTHYPYNSTGKFDSFGPGTIKYKLPKDLNCEHCVLQWFWTTAHSCNPRGILEYYNGPDKPNWGCCKGQGGASGGFSTVQKACEKKRFPEEYLQCADIKISPRRKKKGAKKRHATSPEGRIGRKRTKPIPYPVITPFPTLPTITPTPPTLSASPSVTPGMDLHISPSPSPVQGPTIQKRTEPDPVVESHHATYENVELLGMEEESQPSWSAESLEASSSPEFLITESISAEPDESLEHDVEQTENGYLYSEYTRGTAAQTSPSYDYDGPDPSQPPAYSGTNPRRRMSPKFHTNNQDSLGEI